MSGPAASLVIPSYRGATRLEVLFAALRAQRFEGDWEAVVVLDGLVDASDEVVHAAGESLPVRLVCFEENRGRPAALNAGFAAAAGEVLVRCDDDLEPDPDYVANHVAAHEGPEPVGVVGLYRNVLPDTPYGRGYGASSDERFRADAYATPEEGRWRYWAGNVSVTRETFDRVGDYDVSFRAYGWEDIDWGYRLARLGIPVVLDAKLETRHHAANSSAAIRARRAFESGHAKAHFEAKHALADDRGPARPTVAQRIWGAAVGALARVGTAGRCERWGGWVDRALPIVPDPVGEKLVALLVESGGMAGHRVGEASGEW